MAEDTSRVRRLLAIGAVEAWDERSRRGVAGPGTSEGGLWSRRPLAR